MGQILQNNVQNVNFNFKLVANQQKAYNACRRFPFLHRYAQANCTQDPSRLGVIH